MSNFRDNLKIQASINPKYFRNTLESIKNDDLEANALSFEKVGINNEKLPNFSRDRWLATKQRQLEYFHTVNNLTKEKKTQTELTLQASKWNLTTKSISLTIPEITKKRTKLLLKKSSFYSVYSPRRKTLAQAGTIFNTKGLQENVSVETIAYGVQQFQLHHLIVRVMGSTKY